MADVYVILGNGNTRKSSTIRALTGVAGRQVQFNVARLNQPIIPVFVSAAALQEKNQGPQAFIQLINGKDYQHALIALRDRPANHQPAGADYVTAFMQAGWGIAQTVLLGAQALRYPLPQGAPIPQSIPTSASMPANQIASIVRSWWYWV